MSSLSGFCIHVLLSLSCISYHVIMCIAFAYVFVSCIRAFSPLSVLHSHAPMSSGVPFYLFSCASVKHFRIGPRLVMRPWFTTSRPPVKFRAIWTSFDTPTVNRETVKVSCVLQPNTSPKWPKTHLTPSIISVVRSRSRGPKPCSIWSLLAPSTYKYVSSPRFFAQSKP